MKLLGPRKTLALCLFLLTSFVNSFSMPSSSSQCSSWKPLNPDSLVSAPCLIEQTLCQPNDDAPQLAASVEYATAVLDAWRADDDDDGSWCDLEWCDVTYQQDADDATLYGHWVRKAGAAAQRTFVLFHTGAGPHDLFLLWKAAYLVANLSCQVFIADVLSDETGWAWSSDRTQYQRVRTQLGKNNLWRQRVELALKVAKEDSSVVTAALGWCLGGRAIAECAQLVDPPQAMVTFHGVFPPDLPQTLTPISKMGSEILVCHGVNDPFVPPENLENAL